MIFYLMRKNDILAAVDIENTGIIKVLSVDNDNKDKLPLCQMKDIKQSLTKWWSNRAVPMTQSGIKEVLNIQGVSLPEEYLLKNLGLSLTDYYWIKPVDSNLSWGKVNLFQNDFATRIDFKSKKNSKNMYTPNASLQGDLEKYWAIDEKGNRILIKGNRDAFSREAINEKIISDIHKLQGYDNYVEYELIGAKNRDYKYACVCKNFASRKHEFVSAYSIVNSQKKPNDVNYYEHFINICEENGIDKKQLIHDLDYMFMIDYITSNTDRHLNNIGIIRNADTLKFERLAPIFDSGCSFFVGGIVPKTSKQFKSIKINSFYSTEQRQVRLIKDKDVVNFEKLPAKDYIKELFERDDLLKDQLTGLIDDICDAYEKKIEFAKELK